MDMVFVREEGVAMVLDTRHDHPDNVEHGQEHGGKADDEHLAGEGHA